MANNAMGIVLRDLALGDTLRERAAARQHQLGATDKELSLRLREHTAPVDNDELWDHLGHTAIESPWIDQPGYAGRSAAITRWASG